VYFSSSEIKLLGFSKCGRRDSLLWVGANAITNSMINTINNSIVINIINAIINSMPLLTDGISMFVVCGLCVFTVYNLQNKAQLSSRSWQKTFPTARDASER
jgi:hypothetical protein